MITIVDVAREAKVAPSTVSLVMNGNDSVSDATRDRIKQVIDRLGYRPLRKRRPAPVQRNGEGHRVAIIYAQSSVQNGHLSILTQGVIAGVRGVLSTQCSQVNLLAGKEVAERDFLFQQMLDHREIDGVILIGPDSSDGYLQRVVRSGVPAVVLNRRPRHGEFSSVCVDYHGGGRRAIRHLLKLGHRHIAHLGGSRKHWPSREMRDGTREALARAGIQTVFDWHRKYPAGEFTNLCDQVLASGATALFTGSYPACDAANYYQSIGVSVPGDISILGLDDLGLVANSGLKMSAVGYDVQEQGALAAQTLLRLIDDRKGPKFLRHMILSIRTRIIEGQTAAAPKETPRINGVPQDAAYVDATQAVALPLDGMLKVIET